MRANQRQKLFEPELFCLFYLGKIEHKTVLLVEKKININLLTNKTEEFGLKLMTAGKHDLKLKTLSLV